MGGELLMRITLLAFCGLCGYDHRVSRERALNQIVTLEVLADDVRAPDGERQAARDTMAKLRKKYDIPEQQSGQFGAKFLIDMAERFEKANREKARREAAAKAARAEETRIWGAPLTDAEREQARRDPLGFAASRDKRTHAQKQQDMNSSWGQPHQPRQQRPKTRPHTPPWRCATPYTFFDPGGEPRQRNAHRCKCQKCGITMEAGEGCVTVIGAYCCEMVPGPRTKNPNASRY